MSTIRLVNKDGGNNYASCDGVYTRNTDVYINNEHPYVNEDDRDLLDEQVRVGH